MSQIIKTNVNYKELEDKTFIDFLNDSIPYGSCSKVAEEKNTALELGELNDITSLYNYNYNTPIKRLKGKRALHVSYNEEAIKVIRKLLSKYKSSQGGIKATIPLLIRQCCYFVVYITLMENFSAVKGERTAYKRTDAQAEFVKAVDLNKKLFQSWKMYPVQDFLNETSDPILLDVSRNGKKRDDLLYTLSCLINKQYPKRFIDVFGGTGAVTTALCKKKVEVLNEFDIFTWNFLDCVSKNAGEVLKICRGFHEEIWSIDTTHPYWNRANERYQEITLDTLAGKVDKSDLANTIKFPDFFLRYQAFAYQELEYGGFSSNKSIRTYASELSQYRKAGRLSILMDRRFRLAAIWYFIHSFHGDSPDNDPNITGFKMSKYPKWLEKLGYDFGTGYYFTDQDDNFNNIPNTKIMSKKLIYTRNDAELISYGKRLAKVDIRQMDFEKLLTEADSYLVKGYVLINHTPITKADNFCKYEIEDNRSIIASPEQTLVYLDPPYFLTEQYANAFTDVQHLRMLEWLRYTKCKWVMSCKDEVTNKVQSTKAQLYRNVKCKETPNGELISSFKEYFLILVYGYTIKDGKVVSDMSNGKKTKQQFYVYKNKKEKYKEIMISNFMSHEMSEASYTLFWNKLRTNVKNRKKTGDEQFKGKVKFFEREDFDSFLDRL